MTAQSLGIGPCERNWGGMKGIRHIGDDSSGKGANIDRSVLVNDARIKHEANKTFHGKGASSMFCNHDMK